MTVNQPNKTTFRKSNWYFMGIIFQVNANRYFRVESVCGFFRLNKHVVVRCGSQLVLLSSTKFKMHKLALITTKHKCSGALDGSAMSRFINLHVFTKIHVFKLIIFEGRSSTFFFPPEEQQQFFFCVQDKLLFLDSIKNRNKNLDISVLCTRKHWIASIFFFTLFTTKNYRKNSLSHWNSIVLNIIAVVASHFFYYFFSFLSFFSW